MTITDEMLYEAAPAAAERYLDALPDREACGHRFSPAFEERMRPLLAERPRGRGRWRRTLLLAAVMALLLAVSVIGVYAELEPAYQVNWTQEDGFVSYHIRAERDILGRFHRMEPGYLPEGYALRSESAEKQSCASYYKNRDGDAIALQQTVQERKSGILLGELQAECVDLGGQEGMLVQYEDGRISLLWTDGPNILELNSWVLSREDVLKIAKSMKYQGGTQK